MKTKLFIYNYSRFLAIQDIKNDNNFNLVYGLSQNKTKC